MAAGTVCRKVDASKVLIDQVKWSVSGKEKDPVTRLDEVVKNEEASLKRLAAQGVRHYTLVTNVGSTAKEDSGTFDRLDKKLQAYAKDFGYEQMACIWREALNPWGRQRTDRDEVGLGRDAGGVGPRPVPRC